MPKNFKHKKNFKSGRNSKSKSGMLSNTTIGASLASSRIISMIPSEMKCSHKYVEQFIMIGSATGTTGALYNYGANCMFDPYLPAGGHQPYGFDQISAWFSTYTVTDVDVVITTLTPNTGACYLAFAWRPSGGSFTLNALTIQDICEFDNTRWVLVPQAPARASDSTTKLGRFSIADIEGKSRTNILSENQFQGTATSNPASIPQLQFCVGDLGGGASSSVQVIIQLNFHATWRGRRTVPVS